MKIIYNKMLPIKGYAAINIFGFVFARKEYSPISKKVINHEAIHTAQMKELFFLFFYLWYMVEYVYRIIQFKNIDKAYRNISFEREAYANELDITYLKKRKRYSFIHYLK